MKRVASVHLPSTPLTLARLRIAAEALAFIGAAVSLGCGGSDGTSPSKVVAANIAPVSELDRTVGVGAVVPGGLVVRVTDAAGRPVPNVNVAFAVTLGNGSAKPRLVPTDADGQAATAWTTGTILGDNQVTASVTGVSGVVKFHATGTPGAIAAISLSTKRLRMLDGVDTLRLTAKALDAFGNATTPGPTFTVRDPSLIAVDADGLMHALRRGSTTYVVATAGSKTDSALVAVLAPGQSICTAVAEPVELNVGQVMTGISGDGFCVHASNANAEYALIPFYNAAVPSAATQVEVRGQGIVTIDANAVIASMRRSVVRPSESALMRDDAREARMRAQERAEVARRIGTSETRARFDIIGGGTARAAVTTPSVGDLLRLNTNATDFCARPDVRVGRVVAVTEKAIVVADTANPAGGFTADEYRSIGVTFDTLVDPTDRRMFGDPSDIDNNGRAIMFFTRAVNELTSAGASSVYLGFYYQRDLFPKTGPSGTCEGSNVGEMFYLLVPDPSGSINGNVRRKDDVVSFTLGTVAHEYQHLINASRRMYVNKFGTTFEEKWLDEGLAHAAEELNFWAASGRTPRSNLDATVFSDPRGAAAYNTFLLFNQRRYQQYLGRTETQGPIGYDANDDDLYTRGAAWSFLRYAADRVGAGAEPAFWFKLANANATGITNLASAIGAPVSSWLRDWALSVYLDDTPAGIDARFLQPSLNFRSLLTSSGTTFPLATRTLSNNVTTTVPLVAYGVSFLRFSVANGQDALLTTTSLRQSLPSAIQLAIVRVR